MTHLIIGKGEVGNSLYEIFKKVRPETKIRGQEPEFQGEHFDVIHIAFPYKEKASFFNAVRDYSISYSPHYVIVHSSVPINTCIYLGVYHSPLEGKHPNLAESMLAAKKWISYDEEPSQKLLEEFKILFPKMEFVEGTRNTEAAKIYSTTEYGYHIIIEKMIKSQCRKLGLDYDFVYNRYRQNYNELYQSMGLAKYTRPMLDYMPGKILGHCVIPNCEIQRDEFTNFVRKYNDKIKD